MFWIICLCIYTQKIVDMIIEYGIKYKIIVGWSKTLIKQTFINYKLNMKIIRNIGRNSYVPALHYTHNNLV